jgi:hypothetical protein
MLVERQDEARRLGVDVATELGGHAFSMVRSRKEGAWRLDGEDCTVMLDEHPDSKADNRHWRVSVECRGMWLATRERRAPAEFGRELARVVLVAVTGERLVRVDLAADVAGLPVDRIARGAWVSRGQARVQPHYGRDTILEGWSIGERGEFFLRAYDKTRQLLTQDEGKQEYEHETWKAAGWDGAEPVTRVEYELRGEVLGELQVREPSRFLEAIDSVWKYATDARRLVRRRTATRASRCLTDPRWDVVRAATFERENAQPAKRTRKAAGFVSGRRLFGAALSFGVATGTLTTSPVLLSDGRRMSAAEVIAHHGLDKAACERIFRRELARTMRAAGDECASVILRKFEGNGVDALAYLREAVDSRQARRWGLRVPPATELAA